MPARQFIKRSEFLPKLFQVSLGDFNAFHDDARRGEFVVEGEGMAEAVFADGIDGSFPVDAFGDLKYDFLDFRCFGTHGAYAEFMSGIKKADHFEFFRLLFGDEYQSLGAYREAAEGDIRKAKGFRASSVSISFA